jgi:glycosyltransferase involved in cell wall biosynthesis
MAGLARKTWVLPNAVDQAFFEVCSGPPVEAPPLVLCVGHICPRKNQNAFIRALDPLAAKMKFRVLFLGQTSPGRDYDDEFLALVDTRPWCGYGNFVDREKLREHFRAASAVALPSLEDNCPMVVLEAMAAGVPVVAAEVGGVPDLIREPETGIFCDPLDARSVASAIGRVLGDRAAAREMAVRARADARQRFHPKVIAQGHLEIYREVLRAKA